MRDVNPPGPTPGNRKPIKSLLIIVFVLLACLVMINPHHVQSPDAGRQATQTWATCTYAVYNSEKYAPIRPHLVQPLRTAPTSEQRGDETRPTEKEVSLFIQYHDDVLPCRKAYLSLMQEVAPDIAHILTCEWIKTDAITLELTQGKITYGEEKRQKLKMMEAYKPILQAETAKNARNNAFVLAHPLPSEPACKIEDMKPWELSVVSDPAM